MPDPPQTSTRAIAHSDPDYPPGLRDLADAPPLLYLRGVLPARAGAVAIVGSRAATPYGLAQARRLAGDLASLGIAVVSGLARGIDAAAHRGALEAGGRTVAVLPGSLDAISPTHHRELAERVARSGGLVSEIARGGVSSPWMFVRRNRLIAALSAATVVVEAAERSGALSTAAAARRLSRPVLAVPGDVDRETSRGCHALLRSGAALCAGVADVMRVVGGDSSQLDPGEPSLFGALESDPRRLLTALEPEARPLEWLAERSGLPLDRATAALLLLEWSGLAAAAAGQRWSRVVTAA